VDYLEREYYDIEKEKMEENRLEGNVEYLGLCCVCRDGASDDTNEMLYCDR